MNMPRKAGISFAISAIEDLEDIRQGYSEQDAHDVGERLLQEILTQVERLAEFPESGRIVPEFGVGQLREIIHPPFRVVYRLDEDRVRVVRVWRSELLLKMP